MYTNPNSWQFKLISKKSHLKTRKLYKQKMTYCFNKVKNGFMVFYQFWRDWMDKTCHLLFIGSRGVWTLGIGIWPDFLQMLLLNVAVPLVVLCAWCDKPSYPSLQSYFPCQHFVCDTFILLWTRLHLLCLLKNTCGWDPFSFFLNIFPPQMILTRQRLIHFLKSAFEVNSGLTGHVCTAITHLQSEMATFPKGSWLSPVSFFLFLRRRKNHSSLHNVLCFFVFRNRCWVLTIVDYSRNIFFFTEYSLKIVVFEKGRIS